MTTSLRAANVTRELVRHLRGDQVGLSLLAAMLGEWDVTLLGLVPPPPAAVPDANTPPERTPEAEFVEPKLRRRR